MKIKALFFLGLMFVGAAVVRADGFKEGKWSLTMVTKMDGASPEMANAMAQMKNLPPQALAMMQQHGMQMNADGQGMTITTTQCLTQSNPVPKHNHGNENCQDTHQINGDTVTFHAACASNGMQMTSDGTMKYAGDTVQGHITAKGATPGGPMNTSIDITGKYLGACDK